MEYTTLFEVDVAFAEPLEAATSAQVRTHFAALTERAFELISTRKMEFDDVLLEHVGVLVDTADAEPSGMAVVLPSLGHPEAWGRAFDRVRREEHGLARSHLATTRFERLVLRVVREVDPPLPDFRVLKGY
ncbi:MAG TPA: hypothetical protein P5572_07390 [Phycisphaerae bacterium]|nr:hypothetical protein [Phycisphaerae bacterium]